MKFLPLIVYKYRDWGNPLHRNSLIYNELYLASPKDFNDPFDCRITSNFLLLSKDEEERYINDIAIAAFSKPHNKNLDLREVLSKFERRFSNKENFQKEADTLLFNNQDKYYGIVSFSARWNSILMWSHYANCHRGFCIGYWMNKLWNSNIFGKLGYVNYATLFPEIKPRAAKKDLDLMRNSFLETHTKSVEWEYEDEFRFMKNFFPHILKPHQKTINIPDDFIAEVIIGINTPLEYRDEIIEICKHKKIPISEATKENFKFEIGRKFLK